MTTLVAHVHPQKGIFLGCDSMASTSQFKRTVMKPKWVVSGDRAIGIAGYLRAVNVMEAKADSILDEDLSPFEVASAIREALVEDGFESADREENGGPPIIPSDIILVADGTVFEIDESFALSEIPPGGFAFSGSGQCVASGAIFALQQAKILDPDRIIQIALRAAAHHDLHTSCPIWVGKYRNERQGWIENWYE